MSDVTSHSASYTLPDNLPANTNIHLNPAVKHIQHTNNTRMYKNNITLTFQTTWRASMRRPSSTGQHPLLHMETGQRLKAADELAGSPAPWCCSSSLHQTRRSALWRHLPHELRTNWNTLLPLSWAL